MIEDLKKTDEESVVIRLKKDLHTRLSTLAEKKSKTITALTNMAIEQFIDLHEWEFKDLEKVIEHMPSLKIHLETIKKYLGNAPSYVYRDIINVIDKNETFMFEESLENIENRINNLDRTAVNGIYIHFAMKKTDISKISEIMKNIVGTIKSELIKVKAVALEGAEDDRILLFISYLKKEIK
ncbi:MAG: hypothetical protein AABW89_00370 [Nanoarchaeota archaeon]